MSIASLIGQSLLLNDLYEKDQYARIQYLDDPNSENKIFILQADSLNNKITDLSLPLYGFLSYKKIGYKAYKSLLTLYQHFDERSFIENFPLIQTAFKDKEILKPEFAYILDRYLILKIKSKSLAHNTFMIHY